MTSLDLNPNGPPETVLKSEPDTVLSALDDAMEEPLANRRAAVASVVATWPRFLDAWARLGDLGRDPIESCAAYRIGYHQGLDSLRQSGWRGSGYVRWEHQENRGFLRSLHGLQTMATTIGEGDEAERCHHLLRQMDPSWPPPKFRS